MEFSATSAPIPSPKAGKLLLGKYELGHLLGRGTFAKVYYARSISDGVEVAIKVIDKSKIRGTTMATCITREVAIMHRLIHPNIIRLHEVLATKSKIFLVMEYAKGGNLFSKICQDGRLTETDAHRSFQQLLSALQFCHSNGITHRDIKPENLLLDQNGNLKVSDFGLSALPEQLKEDCLLHTACGTPAYTAPEVLRQKGYNGAKADAWSCGVILYALLAGCLPFDDTNIAVMYRKMQKRDFDFPPWLSRPVQRVISCLLDPNPDTRISLEALMDLPWLKRSQQKKGGEVTSNIKDSYPYPYFTGAYQHTLGKQAPAMNAFDIISLSSGLDLSGLFEERKRSERRFTSLSSIGVISGRIEEMGAKLGFMVERINGELVVGVWKGGLVLSVEMLQLASSVVLVDLKVLGDQGREFEKICWGDLKAGLEDFVLAWH